MFIMEVKVYGFTCELGSLGGLTCAGTMSYKTKTLPGHHTAVANDLSHCALNDFCSQHSCICICNLNIEK